MGTHVLHTPGPQIISAYLSSIDTLSLKQYQFYLNVLGLSPQIANKKIIPLDSTNYIDSDFTFFVDIAQGTNPLSFFWFKNKTPLQPSPGSDTLTLFTLALSDTGNYTCLVSNQWGIDTTLPYPLTIKNTAPVWKTDTIFLSLEQGQPFSCSLADLCFDKENDWIVFTITNTP